MQEIQKKLRDLQVQIDAATQAIGLQTLSDELAKLLAQSQSSNFWSNSDQAQQTMKRLTSLEKRVSTWQTLQKSCEDLLEMARLDDQNLADELTTQYDKLAEQFNETKNELKFSGPYDQNDAIVDIFAGAGGTDAQDWAQMLMRMYVRWAESRGLTVQTITLSSGEEAGIKSVTLEISGDFAYGKLKGEHGVHRLVRLSPFNSDNLRQTSFAKVDVLPKISEPDQVEIDDKDLKIDVFRAGGHGGQSVNTTDSAVRVTHVPTGVVVSIQNERSQLQNKETAMTILRSRLAQMKAEQHKEKISELKGPNQSAEWGNQIRNYVLHPYKQVKDTRTRYETTEVQKVLDGDIDDFITAYQELTLGAEK